MRAILIAVIALGLAACVWHVNSCMTEQARWGQPACFSHR
jgi:hypothetical protein